MATKRALITADIHQYLQQQLENIYTVDVEFPLSKERLLEIIPNYEVIVITTYLQIDKGVIDNAKQLKIIARVGSGLENVDVEYATQNGIRVINSPEGNCNAVGEHTLGLLLNLMNKINISQKALQQHIWNRENFRGEELDGKTVGIIGYGHTGAAFAKKLRGFDVTVLINDIEQKNSSFQQVDLKTIQDKSDIISLHLPYTPLTHHLVDENFISACKNQPYIINTSRGNVVDTNAILQALEQQTIRGFGVDVFEDEPITKNKIIPTIHYDKLLNLDNVVASSHVAGWTKESKLKLVEVLWHKMQDII